MKQIFIDYVALRYSIALVENGSIALMYADRLSDIVLFVRSLQPAQCYIHLDDDDERKAKVVAALCDAGIDVSEEPRLG